jgi:hypothetical protein
LSSCNTNACHPERSEGSASAFASAFAYAFAFLSVIPAGNLLLLLPLLLPLPLLFCLSFPSESLRQKKRNFSESVKN